MGEIWHLPHLGDDDDGPIAFETDRAIYLFTGVLYRPTYMMLLRRTSPDFMALEGLIWDMPRSFCKELLHRFGGVPKADLEGFWDELTLVFRTRELIESSKVRIYAFETDELRYLMDPESPFFQFPPLFGAPEGGDGADALKQTRLELAAEFGRILLPRWASKDAADATLWEHNELMQGWIALGAVGDSAASAAKSVWDAYASIPGQAWDFVTNLPELGEATLRLGRDGIEFVTDFVQGLDDITWEKVTHKLAEIGLEIQGGLERALELMRKGAEAFQRLLGDDFTRAIIADFCVGWKESISDLDRRTMWVRGLTTIAVTIGAEVLIALGLAITGVGAKAAVANLLRRIGQFTWRAIQLMARLYRLMARMASKAMEIAGEMVDEGLERADDWMQRRRAHRAPTPNPHPGLHNREWDEIDVPRDSFKPRRQVDMDNLSAQDKAVARQLRRQGRSEKKIAQVLRSGDDFRMKPLEPGGKLYGFDDLANRHGNKNPSSPYWLDEAGYQDVKSRFYKDGAWDREGVKNYLALPCSNRANVIDTATVAEPHTAVESTIGKATEQIAYTQDDYSTGMMGKIMPGGGTQVTPDTNAISQVSRLDGTP